MPPTDNLYKFIFISGIIIYLYSLTFAVQQFREKREMEFKYYSQLNNIQVQISEDSIMMAQLKYEFYQLKKLDLNKFDLSASDTLLLKNREQEIFFSYQTLVSKNEINRKRYVNIQNRLTEPEIYFEGARQVFYVLFLSGVVLIPLGFLLWYIKLHRPNMAMLERKLALENIQIKKDRKVKISIGIAILLFYIASITPFYIFEKVISKGKEVKKELIEKGILTDDKN